MASSEDIIRFFEPEGPLSKVIPGFRARPAQVDMALAVNEALETPSRRLVVEAGTGTGKSLAYLVPALLSDRKVLVATGTKALQDQLFEKDCPQVALALLESCGLDRTVALMKGRQNYLCLLRHERFRQNPLFVFHEDAKHYAAIDGWAQKTRTGDRAELETLPDSYRTWSDLDAQSETCVGSKCTYYNECYVTMMRRRAEEADLIIANHHLLCADVRVRLEALPRDGMGDEQGFAQVIPAVDAIIIDEAHALGEVATSYFGVSFTSGKSERLVADTVRVIDGLDKKHRQPLEGPLARIRAATEGVFEAATAHVEVGDRSRLGKKHRTPDLERAANEAQRGFSDLALRLELLEEEAVPQSQLQVELSGLVRRAVQLESELKFVFDVALDDPHFVTFVEGQKRGLGLGAAPVDVAEALARTLFADERPVVLTSATLAVGKSLEPFARRVGALKAGAEAAAALVPAGDTDDENAVDDGGLALSILPSPFDYKTRAALYAPADMPEPDAAEWTARFDDEVRFLLELSQGGALVLFTSHRALSEASLRLAPHLAKLGLHLLKQGDAPKLKLLEALRDADRGAGAALFATQSFWEGVDIPGAALRMVIIDRLPFRSPKDPVQEARSDLCRQSGGSPFFDLALPEAALALKQGAGRLIRTEADAGVLAVLDGRIRRRRYGKVFLDSLPPFTRVGSRKVVEQFWQRQVAPALAGAEAEPSDDDADSVDNAGELPSVEG